MFAKLAKQGRHDFLKSYIHECSLNRARVVFYQAIVSIGVIEKISLI